MGMFGFFNYNKPGPGISKDAPKKRTFVVFFETWFRNIWRLLPSGLLYCLFNLLLLPSGLGSAGMTHLARNMARDKHSFGISDFFDTIKKNWKQALAMGIINVLVTSCIIASGLLYYFNFQETLFGFGGMLGTGLMISLFFITSVMKYYVWLIIITFKMPLGKILKNSFYFVFINLKYNLLIGLCSILWYALSVGICLLCISNAGIFPLAVTIVFLLNILFYPGFKHLLIQFCVFPSVKKMMIDPYYEQNPDADIELRRNLGLDVPGDEDDEEEVVFNDKQLIPEDKEN